jgi:DHA1 family bicyclomycin/chloramphenicol resistance-like MFS transporter
VVSVIGTMVGILWVLIDPQGGPPVIFIPQLITSFASGFLLPNAIAGAVSARPQAAGAASGITGFMQFGLGAVTAQIIGHLIDGATTAMPLAVTVLGMCACALVAFVGLVRK